MNEIITTLNKEQAESLFAREAILIGANDVIPEHRIVELFGEWAGAFIEKTLSLDGYMTAGKDWNGAGACSAEEPFIHVFYRSGFFKIVSKHNYRLTVQAHRLSEGGKVMDEQWRLRSERLEAAEAEEARKQEERRTKRAAARKAKQAAQESVTPVVSDM